MGYPIKQSQAARPLLFQMVLSADHVTPATGLAPAVTIRKVGGAFAAPAGAVSEVANGWYQVAPNAADSNTLGPLLLHATAATADPCPELYDVVAYDPDNASLGILDLVAGVETNRTVRQALRIMLAALAGEVSGAGTGTITFRDSNDTKDRIVATVDSSGNRTSVTLDGS